MENRKNKENFKSIDKKPIFHNVNSNIRLLKITDLYKDVYSPQTGQVVNILRRQNQQIKQKSMANSLLDKERM